MKKNTTGENMRICVVCNINMNKDESESSKIDGLWICGSNCLSKFQDEKKKWASKEWDKLCKMHASYVEQKRAEINAASKEPIE